jgi:exportin-7
VTTPVLKLFAELVQNRSQRLQFDVSSPNGILLFREASKIICTYGKADIGLSIGTGTCMGIDLYFYYHVSMDIY